MKWFILGLIVVVLGRVNEIRDEANAQTVQLNEIIQHIDGLNKSQNDILKYCHMGD